MPYPTNEVLKTLKAQIDESPDAVPARVPEQEAIFTGVVKEVFMGGTGEAFGQIIVYPYEPGAPDDKGNIDFASGFPNDTGGIGTPGVTYRKVFAINCPAELTPIYYTPGQVIQYWRKRTAHSPGHWVTLLQDNSFWAKMTNPSGVAATFTAIKYDGTQTAVKDKLVEYTKPAGGTFTGSAWNTSSLLRQGVANQIVLASPQQTIARVYPMLNPSGGTGWEYYYQCDTPVEYMVYVSVAADSGSDGDGSAPVDYTYTFQYSGTIYTHQSPLMARSPKMAAGTRGMAVVHFDGTVSLVWVDEAVEPICCTI